MKSVVQNFMSVVNMKNGKLKLPKIARTKLIKMSKNHPDMCFIKDGKKYLNLRSYISNKCLIIPLSDLDIFKLMDDEMKDSGFIDDSEFIETEEVSNDVNELLYTPIHFRSYETCLYSELSANDIYFAYNGDVYVRAKIGAVVSSFKLFGMENFKDVLKENGITDTKNIEVKKLIM